MKRTEVQRQISKIAKQKGLPVRYTEGGSHTKIVMGDTTTWLPRYGEVNERTTRSIIKKLEGAK